MLKIVEKSDADEIFISTQRTYDLIASDYSQQNHQLSVDVLENLEKFTRSLPRAGAILDVGCGNGRDMSWFESKGFQVVGVDISKQMLEHARPRVSGSLVKANCLNLPQNLCDFDGIWCSASLLHVPKVYFTIAIQSLLTRMKTTGLFFASFTIGNEESLEKNPCYGGHARFFARYTVRELSEKLSRLPGISYKVDEKSGWATLWIQKLS